MTFNVCEGEKSHITEFVLITSADFTQYSYWENRKNPGDLSSKSPRRSVDVFRVFQRRVQSSMNSFLSSRCIAAKTIGLRVSVSTVQTHGSPLQQCMVGWGSASFKDAGGLRSSTTARWYQLHHNFITSSSL